MIVVDASVLVSALGLDGRQGAAARARLRGEHLVAPEVIDLEVASAWRRLSGAGSLTPLRAATALQGLVDARLTRITHTFLLPRCWQLRHALTMYEAAYVALAEAVGVPLVTADGRLARAPGPRCVIEVIEPGPDEGSTLEDGALAKWLTEDEAAAATGSPPPAR